MKATKKTAKSIISVLLIAIMMLSLTACGVDMKKMSGTWVLSTIDGQTVADYVGKTGLPEVCGMKVVRITETDFSIDFLDASGAVATDKGTNTIRANGIEVKITVGNFFEKDSTVGVIYDEKADTISMKVLTEGQELNLVFKKGSYDLKAEYEKMCAEYAAQAAAEAGAAAENEDGGYEEEYSEEGYEEYDEGDWE